MHNLHAFNFLFMEFKMKVVIAVQTSLLMEVDLNERCFYRNAFFANA